MSAENKDEMSSNTPKQEVVDEQAHMNEPTGVRRMDQPTPAQPEPVPAETAAQKDEMVSRAAEPVSRSPVTSSKAAMPDEEPDLWAGMDGYRHRFDEIQAAFIEEPKAAVKKAEELVEEAVERVVKSLHERVNTIHSAIGDGTDDTERLRLAMRGYKHLIDAFGEGHESHESRAA